MCTANEKLIEEEEEKILFEEFNVLIGILDKFVPFTTKQEIYPSFLQLQLHDAPSLC